MCTSFLRTKRTSVGLDVKKRYSPSWLVEMSIALAFLVNHVDIPQTTRHCASIWPSSFAPGNICLGLENTIQKKHMLSYVHCSTGYHLENTQAPMNRWVEYYSATKKIMKFWNLLIRGWTWSVCQSVFIILHECCTLHAPFGKHFSGSCEPSSLPWPLPTHCWVSMSNPSCFYKPRMCNMWLWSNCLFPCISRIISRGNET